MDPECILQDVVRCHYCQTSLPSLHCFVCNINLCKPCVGEHLSDNPLLHRIVKFESRLPLIKCQKHSSEIVQLYCEQCRKPICLNCASSKYHRGHEFVDLVENIEKKKKELQKDLMEIQNYIFPLYNDRASEIFDERAELDKNSKKLASAFEKHGEIWHRAIDTIIGRLKSEVEEMYTKNVVLLNQQESEITHTISEITQTISDLNELLNSKDAHNVYAYKSRNAKFKKLPPKLAVFSPSFMPYMINEEHIYQQFGSLSTLKIKTEEIDCITDSPGAEFAPSVRQLINEPQIITCIETEYDELNGLRSVQCLNDEEVWLCGDDNIIRLYNLQEHLVKSVQTKSKKMPWDIAVSKNGDLVYADCFDKSVNIVKNTQIQEVIRLLGWKPLNICCSSSGDLLVIMSSEDDKQSKVVRYSGSTETQTIQFNDDGHPLFLSDSIKYISENRNLDICVALWSANTVVVVNETGKLRFTYNGPPCTTKGSFRPRGITTDSLGHILTADSCNYCVHILDQDGHFIRYIDNIPGTFGLCVNTKDSLFVAEYNSGQVKKIEYLV